MTSIVLVEDHPLFRDGFAAMVGRHRPDWRLQGAGTAGEGLAAVGDGRSVDLVIIDINLPDMDGFDAARVFAARAPLTPRVMISGREDVAARLRSRDCGASGFIAKSCSPLRILGLLDQVLMGRTAFEPDAEVEAGATVALTARQLQVLTLLAEGCANKVIERRMSLAPRTVRAHLTEIFHILGADGRVRAILRARELGLIA